jgi:D-sedoheptulose 7-phosphate isomerase
MRAAGVLVSSFSNYCAEVERAVRALPDEAHAVERAVHCILEALAAGRKLMLCGNGGSTAAAQHLAAEFMGRFRYDRRPIAAIALTADSSLLTALANDYGFEDVFSRQVQGLGAAGDVVIAFSTSGASANVNAALAEARRLGVRTIGFTARPGGDMAELCEIAIRAPSETASVIQELHLIASHHLCAEIERAISQAADKSLSK